MSDLITLSRLLNALDKAPGDLTTQEIESYKADITAASEHIRAETQRSFEVYDPDADAVARTYPYDGGGSVNIDDAFEVESVAVRAGWTGATERTLTPDEYSIGPLSTNVYEWVELVDVYPWGISPEMGFRQNLDRIAQERSLSVKPTVVTVTAKWGWEAIPQAVQRATILTVMALYESPEGYDSEAIEGYARSRGLGTDDALPRKARDLIGPYLRYTV